MQLAYHGWSLCVWLGNPSNYLFFFVGARQLNSVKINPASIVMKTNLTGVLGCAILIGMADLILILHFLWVGVVVGMVPAIILGAAFQWRWIRRPWVRRCHLLMMAIVSVEALLGIVCPLTLWESQLRGQGGTPPSFTATWVSRLLFYDFPTWVFTLLYLAFLSLIIFLYWKVPPKKEGLIPQENTR